MTQQNHLGSTKNDQPHEPGPSRDAPLIVAYPHETMNGVTIFAPAPETPQ